MLSSLSIYGECSRALCTSILLMLNSFGFKSFICSISLIDLSSCCCFKIYAMFFYLAFLTSLAMAIYCL